MIRNNRIGLAVSVCFLAGCAATGPSEPAPGNGAFKQTDNDAAGPVQFRLPDKDQPFDPLTPIEINPVVVRSQVTELLPNYPASVPSIPQSSQGQSLDLYVTDVPVPRIRKPRAVGKVDVPATNKQIAPTDGTDPLAATAEPVFDSLTTDDNVANTGGFLFIPADPSGTAGPDHVVAVTNVSIQFHTKSGTPLLDSTPGGDVTGVALSSFFAALTPANATFDPKVIYDQYEDRFLVVTLEKEETSFGDPADTSRILLAVSDDSDPLGTWYFTAIDSKIEIGGTESWADYPGFAVDEEAVYITANMFGFNSSGGGFTGNRIWIIEKTDGLGSGLYDGGTATVDVYDPIPPGVPTGTQQPAHVLGSPPASAAVGTWLTMFSGLTDGTNEFLQVFRVDNPVGPGITAFVGPSYINLGDIDDLGFVPLPDAPMASTTELLETNDRRTYHSVWRNNMLYVTTSISPNAGDPEAGQTTAYWVQMQTDPAPLLLFDQGRISGEEIATGAHTFFASIAVNDSDDVAIGFSAAAETIFPSSAYTTRRANDAFGTTTTPQLLRPGLDYYIRTFDAAPSCNASPASNRWGDYSGLSVDPVDQCFWVFNKHAVERGTGTTGGCNGRPAVEDGRWGTAFGYFCESCATQLALTSQSFTTAESFQARDIISLSLVTVESSGDLSLTAGSARFDDGFEVQAGGTFAVEIGACD